MVRVPAVWPDAIYRRRPELAAFVHLVADWANDGELRQIVVAGHLTHAAR